MVAKVSPTMEVCKKLVAADKALALVPSGDVKGNKPSGDIKRASLQR